MSDVLNLVTDEEVNVSETLIYENNSYDFSHRINLETDYVEGTMFIEISDVLPEEDEEKEEKDLPLLNLRKEDDEEDTTWNNNSTMLLLKAEDALELGTKLVSMAIKAKKNIDKIRRAKALANVLQICLYDGSLKSLSITPVKYFSDDKNNQFFNSLILKLSYTVEDIVYNSEIISEPVQNNDIEGFLFSIEEEIKDNIFFKYHIDYEVAAKIQEERGKLLETFPKNVKTFTSFEIEKMLRGMQKAAKDIK